MSGEIRRGRGSVRTLGPPRDGNAFPATPFGLLGISPSARETDSSDPFPASRCSSAFRVRRAFGALLARIVPLRQRLAASTVVFWRLGPIRWAALFEMEQKTRA